MAALTKEYKLPHRSTLYHINKGLVNGFRTRLCSRRMSRASASVVVALIAAVITQGFSYTLKAGLRYGQIYTGETIIFLHIPGNLSTVYHAFPVFGRRRRSVYGMGRASQPSNCLHLAVVGLPRVPAHL